MMKKDSIITISAMTISLILWSSSFSAIKAGLQSYQSGSVALFRFLIASVIFLICSFFIKMSKPKKEDLSKIILAGIAGIPLYHLALNYGETYISASSAGILMSTTPIFTAFLSLTILKEKINFYKWIGIFISLIGVIIISFSESDQSSMTLGSLLVLLAAFNSALYIVLQKFLLSKHTPFELTAYNIWIGTLGLLFYLPALIHDFKTAAFIPTISVLYLGIFPSAIAYMTFSYALLKKSAVNAAGILNLSPVLATIFAFFLLQEVPSLRLIIGGIITIAGVMIMDKSK